MLVPARRWTVRHLLAVTMVAVLIPGLRANAQEAGGRQGWTPALQLQYRAIQGTAISPDGQLIAYVVRTPLVEGEQSKYLSHIWLASADGARDNQFTRGEASTGSPRFSPDGSMLAFTSSRSDTSQVWVMPVGGGEAWRVTGAAEGVGSFAWSPDGSRIAYTMRNPDSEAVATAKKEKRWVERVDQDYEYAHLYVADVGDGGGQPGEAARLTEGDFHVSSFDWSPDGQHIVFSHAPDPRLNTNSIISDISLVGVSDGEVTPLVTLAGVERSPRFSPDGRWVAFVGTGEQA